MGLRFHLAPTQVELGDLVQLRLGLRVVVVLPQGFPFAQVGGVEVIFSAGLFQLRPFDFVSGFVVDVDL